MVELRGITGGREAEPGAGVVAAVEELAAGRLVVLVDEESAHLVSGGTLATTNAMATMAAYGHGVLRVALAPERLAALRVAAVDGDGLHMPVDLLGHERPGNHSGRAATVRALAGTEPADLHSPGHVFPVARESGGVLARPGVAEAAADLARIASGVSVAAYTMGVDEGGAPADPAAGGRLARLLGLRNVTVEEVVAYRERVEPGIERVVSTSLPMRVGDMTAIAYRSERRGGRDYAVFVSGDPGRRGVRVHVHAGCWPGDVFGGGRCDCRAGLESALEEIAVAGAGVVVHTEHPRPLRHVEEGGEAEAAGGGAVELDVAHILRSLGVREVVLSANEALEPERFGAAGLVIRAQAEPGCDSQESRTARRSSLPVAVRGSSETSRTSFGAL